MELMSVSALAERLGIGRSTLTNLLNAAKVTKIRQGRESLVALADAQKIVQEAAAAGKLRVKKADAGRSADSSIVDPRESFYMGQITHLQDENRVLREKLNAADSVVVEVKLLKAAASEKDRVIEVLTDKVGELEGADARAQRLQQELEAAKKALESAAEQERRLESLTDKVEELESAKAKAMKLQKELDELKQKQEDSLLGKASKIYGIVRGK